MLLRIVEAAKHADEKPKHIMWITAEDSFQNPGELAKDEETRQQQRERLLQFNDQKFNGIPGLLPIFLRPRANTVRTTVLGTRWSNHRAHLQ